MNYMKLPAWNLLLFLFILSASLTAEEKKPKVDAEIVALRLKMEKTPAGLLYSGRYPKALEESAKSDDYLGVRAQALVETGKDLEALKLLDTALADKPENVFLLGVRGETLMVSGQYRKAFADFGKAIQLSGEKRDVAVARAHLGLARMFHLMARRDDWLSAADWFFDAYGELGGVSKLSAEMAYYIGFGAVIGENFKEGFKVCAAAQKKDKTFLPATLAIADMFYQKYQYEDAESEYRQALRINPLSSEAHTGMAALRIFQRNLDKTEWHLRKALKTNPRCVTALLRLAQLDAVDEKPEEALKECDKVLLINPNSPDALILKACLYYSDDRMDEYEKTRKRLLDVYSTLPFPDEDAKALALKVGESRLLTAVAEYLSSNHRIEDALPLLRTAVEKDPENAKAQASLGVCLMRHGRSVEAKPALDDAFELDRFNVWVYNLRKLREREKEYERIQGKRFLSLVHKRDAPIIADYVRTRADEFIEECEKRFGFKVKKEIQLSFLKSHADFSARVTGLPRLDATGATFGPFVAVVSPAAMKSRGRGFNWESTLLHEIAHVVTIMGSGYRIPRWLTEGMSVYSEGWITPERDLSLKTMIANGPLPDLNDWNRQFNRPRHRWQVPAAYSAAGLFVQWFAEEYGRDSLPKLVKLYGEGRNTPEIMLAITGKDIPFLNQWLAGKLKEFCAKIYINPMIDPALTKEYEKAFADDPDDLAAAMRLLRLYEGTQPKKAWEMSLKLLEKAEKLRDAGKKEASDPVFGRAALIAGRAALLKGKPDGARALLELSLRINKVSPATEFILGLVAVKEEKMEEAEKRFRTAIKEYPRFVMDTPLANPYRALVKLLIDGERKQEAIPVLKQYTDIRRNDAKALRKLGELLVAAGEEKEALKSYRKACAIDPYLKEDHEQLAILLDKAGDKASAEAERKIAKALEGSGR